MEPTQWYKSQVSNDLVFEYEPTQWYKSQVSNDLVFEYLMVLGPAVVVPALISWNALAAAAATSY
jgi:hypothetical protein